MNKQIKLLLLVVGSGLLAAAAHASCNQCDQEVPPPEVNCPPAGPGHPSDSMSESIIVDDSAQSSQKPETEVPADKTPVMPSENVQPVAG